MKDSFSPEENNDNKRATDIATQKKHMHKPIISPQPTQIPQRPVSRFADGNSLMCPTDVMKTALQNDNSKPNMHSTSYMHNTTTQIPSISFAAL